MFATDFVYDGIKLSDYNCMVCEIDGSTGLDEIEAGVALNFTTVSTRKGTRFPLVDRKYDSALSVTFDICKDPCSADAGGQIIYMGDENLSFDVLDQINLQEYSIAAETINLDAYVDTYSAAELEITDHEYLVLLRFLARDHFLPMTFLDERHCVQRYYNGAFTSISRLEIGGRLYGLRVTFQTDRPYALGEEVSSTHDIASTSYIDYTDNSYLTGTIIPDLVITLHESGTLRLTNMFTSTSMVITGCVSGETITVKGDSLILFSSIPTHNVWKCFNYDFLKIGNSMGGRVNRITSTLDCTLTIKYQPVIRDAPS